MKIKFLPKSNDIINKVLPPKPSLNYIPDWYKEIKPFHNKNKDILPRSSAKKCIPFLDSFSFGYIQELWCDVFIESKKINNEIQINYSWSEKIKPISSRKELYLIEKDLPNFFGFYNVELQWETQWEPILPPGYSSLYVSPLNRNDLPFLTFSGIIDSDKYPIHGPIPFLIKEGFNGLIPAGTPIYQIIPFKRDDWFSEYVDEDYIDAKSISYNVKKFFYDGYKKIIWERKNFQ